MSVAVKSDTQFVIRETESIMFRVRLGSGDSELEIGPSVRNPFLNHRSLIPKLRFSTELSIVARGLGKRLDEKTYTVS